MYYRYMPEDQVLKNVKKHGIAQGAQKMMKKEISHALEAIDSKIYKTFYNIEKKHECFRIGSGSLCFCGHFFKDHLFKVLKNKRY
jgi:hypothetical protein